MSSCFLGSVYSCPAQTCPRLGLEFSSTSGSLMNFTVYCMALAMPCRHRPYGTKYPHLHPKTQSRPITAIQLILLLVENVQGCSQFSILSGTLVFNEVSTSIISIQFNAKMLKGKRLSRMRDVSHRDSTRASYVATVSSVTVVFRRRHRLYRYMCYV